MEYAQLNPSETNIHRTPEEIKSGMRASIDKTMTQVSERSRQAARYGAGVIFGALITLLARKL